MDVAQARGTSGHGIGHAALLNVHVVRVQVHDHVRMVDLLYQIHDLEGKQKAPGAAHAGQAVRGRRRPRKGRAELLSFFFSIYGTPVAGLVAGLVAGIQVPHLKHNMQ